MTYPPLYKPTRYRDKLTLLSNYLVSTEAVKFVQDIITTMDSLEHNQKEKYVFFLQKYDMAAKIMDNNDIADEDFVRILLIQPDPRLSTGMSRGLCSLLREVYKKFSTNPPLTQAIIDAIECPSCCNEAIKAVKEFLQTTPNRPAILKILDDIQNEPVLVIDQPHFGTANKKNYQSDLAYIDDMFVSKSLLVTTDVDMTDAAAKRAMLQSWLDQHPEKEPAPARTGRKRRLST